jgi:hypothetical protein
MRCWPATNACRYYRKVDQIKDAATATGTVIFSNMAPKRATGSVVALLVLSTLGKAVVAARVDLSSDVSGDLKRSSCALAADAWAAGWTEAGRRWLE